MFGDFLYQKTHKSQFVVRKSKKRVHDQLPVWGISRWHLKVLNDTKLVLNEHACPPQSFRINFISFRNSRDSLSPKPVTGHEPFFTVSYGKPALTTDLRDRQCYESKSQKINQPIFKNSTFNCLWNLDNQLTPYLIWVGFNKSSRTQSSEVQDVKQK